MLAFSRRLGANACGSEALDKPSSRACEISGSKTIRLPPAVLSCPLIAEPETIPSVSYISSVWLRFAFVTSLGCKEPIVVAWALGIDVTRGISLPNSDSVT